MNQFDYQRALFASQMSTNARMTGVVIGSHYNWKTGEYSFVSNKTIAKETNLSISSITRARKELVDNGYLCSERRYDNSCVMTPIIPESITYGLKAELKDTLKDNLKDTLKDTNVSNETSDIFIIDKAKKEWLMSW
jgi:DNA-binding transcriptional ArsR family regulator